MIASSGRAPRPLFFSVVLLASLWGLLAFPCDISCEGSTLRRLLPSQTEIDLAALIQGHPGLRSDGGVRLSPGGRVSLDRALMVLGFDEEPHLLRDARGFYHVLNADYSCSKEARSGKGSALFRLRSQSVSLRTGDHLWPLKHEEAFTISFWFRPLYFFRSSNLFRRVSYAGEHRKGIEILLEQDHVRLKLMGVLHYGEDVADDVSFLSRKTIEKGKWHQLALSLDARHAVAILFLDGREEGRFNLARDGVLPEIDFSAPDLAPIVLGGNYLGHIDDLYLADGAVTGESQLDISPFGALSYNHHSGRGTLSVESITSPVYSLDAALDELELSASGEAREGSSLRLFFRTSDRPFRERDAIPWKRWGELGRSASVQQTVPGEHAAYIQLRAELQPDPSGMHSPVLRRLGIEQHLAHAPLTPRGLRVVEGLSRDGRICLEWKINPEMEIEETGGYRLHVGVQRGEYEAIVDRLPGNRAVRKSHIEDFPLTVDEKRLEDRRPEFIKEWKRSHVRVFVDNALMTRARLENRPRRPLPYFEQDHAYYFAVSAYVHPGAPSGLSAPTRTLFRDD